MIKGGRDLSGNEMNVVKSYVIRIYRYNPGRPQELVGVVEKPESDAKLAFTSLDELWAILNRPDIEEPGAGRGK